VQLSMPSVTTPPFVDLSPSFRMARLTRRPPHSNPASQTFRYPHEVSEKNRPGDATGYAASEDSPACAMLAPLS
jgi:hypothetical protein